VVQQVVQNEASRARTANPPPRVAYLAPPLRVGGTQRHLLQLVAGLDGEVRPRVCAFRDQGEVADALRAAGIAIHGLLGSEQRFGARGVLRVVAFARWLRRERIEVLHCFQWRPSLFGILAARLAGTPVVVAGKRSHLLADRRSRVAWGLIARLADAVVVNTDALAAEIRLAAPGARCLVIPNGVDAGAFTCDEDPPAVRRRLRLDPERPVVGSVGRLEGRKGHAVFIAAAAAVLQDAGEPRPQFVIVGDGPLRGTLAGQAARLGIASAVVLPGRRDDVADWLRAFDLFVLPSRTEGMSNALLEAMAAGRAIVATGVGAARELLASGEIGVSVPPDDPGALAAAIRELLADPDRRGRLGIAARRLALARFGVGAMVARTEALYRSLLVEKRQAVAPMVDRREEPLR
jgi:glycosyltransferase involved in cell wall biosynthesis